MHLKCSLLKRTLFMSLFSILSACGGSNVNDEGSSPVDSQAPRLTAQENVDIDSGGLINLTLQAMELGTEDVPASGFDVDSSLVITSCTADIAFSVIDSETSAINAQTSIELSAPSVENDTPYSCETQVTDLAGNVAISSISGTIRPLSGTMVMLPGTGGEQSVLLESGQNLVVTLPPGSLAEDTAISINDASEATLDNIFTDTSGVVLALDLQPAGLQFNQPLIVSADLDLGTQQDLLIGVLESDGNIELVPNLSQQRLDNGLTRVTIEIPHFSSLSIFSSRTGSQSSISVNLTAPEQVAVNSSAIATTELSLSGAINNGSLPSSSGVNTVLSVFGPISLDESGDVDFNDSTQNATTSVFGNPETTFSNSFSFTCDAEGEFELRSTTTVTGDAGVDGLAEVLRQAVGLSTSQTSTLTFNSIGVCEAVAEGSVMFDVVSDTSGPIQVGDIGGLDLNSTANISLLGTNSLPSPLLIDGNSSLSATVIPSTNVSLLPLPDPTAALTENLNGLENSLSITAQTVDLASVSGDFQNTLALFRCDAPGSYRIELEIQYISPDSGVLRLTPKTVSSDFQITGTCAASEEVGVDEDMGDSDGGSGGNTDDNFDDGDVFLPPDDVTPDTELPVVSSQSQDIFTTKTISFTPQATDNIGVDLTIITDCDAGVSFDNNSRSLTAPLVFEDTPYSCSITAEDAAGNVGLGTVSGIILIQRLTTVFSGPEPVEILEGQFAEIGLTAILSRGAITLEDFTTLEIQTTGVSDNIRVTSTPEEIQQNLENILADLNSPNNTGGLSNSGTILQLQCVQIGEFSLRVFAAISPRDGIIANNAETVLQGQCFINPDSDNRDELLAQVQQAAIKRELNQALIGVVADAILATDVTVFTLPVDETAQPKLNNIRSEASSGDSSDNTAGNTSVIISERGIGVSLVRLPQSERSCITAIEDLTIEGEISTDRYIAAFDCLRSVDGADTSVSVPGSIEFQTVDGATITNAMVDNSGVMTETGDGFNAFNEGRFSEQQIQMFVDGQTTGPIVFQPFQNAEPPMPFQLLDEGARPSALINNAEGLNSTLRVDTSNLGEISTLLFTSSSDTRISGFVDRRPIPVITDIDQNQIMPMVSPELVQYLNDNEIVIDRITVTFANNLDTGVGGIFEQETGLDESEVAPAPTVGVGLTINTSVSALTPIDVCPLPEPVQVTRCTAGQREALLSVNGSDEVAIYNPVTGDLIDFFLTDTQGGRIRTLPASVQTAFEATQAPDNCVLLSDAGRGVGEGQLLLFDTSSVHLPGNALGSLLDGAVSPTNVNVVPLLRGDDQSTRVNSYYGFDFYSADGLTDWKLFVGVGADTSGDGFSDTAQLIRYDYALTGDAVLSNPLVVASDTDGTFQDVVVVGERIYVSQSLSGESDPIRVFQPDGIELAPLVSDLTDPRQISATFDDGLAVVDFPLERIRIINLETGTTRQEYVLGDGDNRGNDRLRGLAPLRNGDYLAAGLSDVNRAVVNRYTGFFQVVSDNRSSSGVYVGRACLP